MKSQPTTFNQQPSTNNLQPTTFNQQPSTFKIVVIGYGNTLRSDDGVGQVVAEAIQDWELPNVCSLCLHQLTPELAETLANTNFAIFVDACPVSENGDEVQVYPIEPGDVSNFQLGHLSNPRSLLALTQAVYNYAPEAWLVAIPTVNLELGEVLSPLAQQGVTTAVDEIRRLIKNCVSSMNPQGVSTDGTVD